MMAITPGKDLILRKHSVEMNYFLSLLAVFLIDIVADEKIKLLAAHDQLFEFSEDLGIGTFLNPVIRINDLEKQSCRILNARIYRSAVSLIRLVNGADYSGILSLIFSGNLKCVVLGRSVIYYQYFDIIPSGQERLYRSSHISC